MFTGLFLAAALVGQASPPGVDPPRPARATAAAKPAASPAAKASAVGNAKKARAGAAAPAAAASSSTTAERARLIAKRRARKGAAYAARTAREAKEDADEAKAIKEAKAEFERTLPARLEAQRQMLKRQTDLERNMIMNRAVSAMEKAAGYSYPGQSPTVGAYR